MKRPSNVPNPFAFLAVICVASGGLYWLSNKRNAIPDEQKRVKGPQKEYRQY